MPRKSVGAVLCIALVAALAGCEATGFVWDGEASGPLPFDSALAATAVVTGVVATGDSGGDGLVSVEVSELAAILRSDTAEAAQALVGRTVEMRIIDTDLTAGRELAFFVIQDPAWVDVTAVAFVHDLESDEPATAEYRAGMDHVDLQCLVNATGTTGSAATYDALVYIGTARHEQPRVPEYDDCRVPS